jgi:hypothetical protein
MAWRDDRRTGRTLRRRCGDALLSGYPTASRMRSPTLGGRLEKSPFQWPEPAVDARPRERTEADRRVTSCELSVGDHWNESRATLPCVRPCEAVVRAPAARACRTSTAGRQFCGSCAMLVRPMRRWHRPISTSRGGGPAARMCPRSQPSAGPGTQTVTNRSDGHPTWSRRRWIPTPYQTAIDPIHHR